MKLFSTILKEMFSLKEDVGTSGSPGGGENAGGQLGPLQTGGTISNRLKTPKVRPTPKTHKPGKAGLLQTNEEVLSEEDMPAGFNYCKSCEDITKIVPKHIQKSSLTSSDKPMCSGCGKHYDKTYKKIPKHIEESLEHSDAAVTKPASVVVNGVEKVNFVNKPNPVTGSPKTYVTEKDINNIKDYLIKRNDRLQKLAKNRSIGGE